MKVFLAYYIGGKFAGRSKAFVEYPKIPDQEFVDQGLEQMLVQRHRENEYMCDVVKGFEKDFKDAKQNGFTYEQ